MKLSDFEASTTNWREQLRINQRKTHSVIALFVLIYTVVGLIVDTLILMHMYPNQNPGDLFFQLITLKVIPWATLIMGGIALVSILITYSLYDRIMLMGTEYREITPKTAQDMREKQLYNVIEEMKVAAGLRFMPRVFIIEANYMNAFASGFSEKSAMVAITRGLMEKLDRAEMQAVMAHELSHIRHLDIKLTLMVAVLSNILLLAVDVVFYSVVYGRDNNNKDNRLFLVILVLRYVLPLLTIILTLFLSRTREYMADAGAVELMRDNDPMARALLKISQDNEVHQEEYAQAYAETPHEEIRQASYLFDTASLDPVKSFSSLFSTHPQILDRLKALGFVKK